MGVSTDCIVAVSRARLDGSFDGKADTNVLSHLLAFALTVASPPLHPAAGPIVRVVEPSIAEALHARLMGTVRAMGVAGDAISHDDVTPFVAPLFPKGQTFAQTRQVLRDHNLGQLKMFKGTQMMSNGKTYVARFDLMKGMASEVFVVIDFDFTGTNEQDMVLSDTKAFLEATSM